MVHESLTPIPNTNESKSRNHGYHTCIRGSSQQVRQLDGYPRLYTRIYSDSKYAVGCMTEWIYKWIQNDWTNSAGNEVANRDLIERASGLDDKVRDLGPVEYIWISREQNEDADRYCNQALDRQNEGYRNMDDHGREDYDMDDSD